jgi:hypothetical protein
MTSASPRSAHGLYLIVSDIQEARGDLAGHGAAEVREVFHAGTPGAQFQRDCTSGCVSGPAPDDARYSFVATFRDLDGNGWLLQGRTTRLPAGSTLLRPQSHQRRSWRERCGARSAAYGEHEKRIGAADRDLPDWYAA